MVKITICGMCQNYGGLNDNKTMECCKAFPKGRDTNNDPEIGKECANGFFFEPKEEYKDVI